jgi:hypothetical protein
MSEAEILAMRIGLTGLIISVVSVSFGMISAYIAGLWLFLKRTPLPLRALTFGLLSIGLLFMGTLTWGLHELLLGTDRSWAKLPVNSMGIASFGGERPEYLFGLTLYEAGTSLGFVAFGAIYIALAYLTFGYRWHNGENKQSTQR